MRPTLAVASILLVAAFLTAGCVQNKDGNGNTAPDTVPRDVTFDGNGKVLASAALPGITIEQRSTGHPGGEPNLGITSKGTILATAGGRAFNVSSGGGGSVVRSTDNGKTWTEVFNLTTFWGPGWNQQGDVQGNVMRNSDPMLWVDTDTDRVFATFMSGVQCAKMFISDDDGVTWLAQPEDCGIPGNDHEKVMTAHPRPATDMVGLPPPAGPLPPTPTAGYPNLVYYCYNRYVGVGAGGVGASPDDLTDGNTHCAVSYNGGLSFQTDTLVAARRIDGCGGINGHPAASPTGVVYVPMTDGCERAVIGVSYDNGATWYPREGPRITGASNNVDPDMTVTPDGTAYLMYVGSDQRPYLIRSNDDFYTFDGPWAVSPPGVTSSTFTVMTSGDNGHLALAFVGTRDWSDDPSGAPDTARWNLYEVFTDNANATVPTFRSIQVTSNEAPVQIGCIWLRGGGNPCRNMRDFIDAVHTPDGRPVVVFTDGCNRGCDNNANATNKESRDRMVTIAYMTQGPGLLAAHPRFDDVPT